MALDLDRIGKPIGPLERDYDWKDVVLYALGVGAGFDELDYVYEKRLKVIPSFSIGAVFDFLMQVATDSRADLSGILHGEQDIFFHYPIPTSGRLTTRGAITHMYDKGANKGALVVAEADTYHDSGAKLFTNVFTLFCRKDGGFGGEDAPRETVSFPEREPDFVEVDHPSPDQPLLYRLSGDVFSLHVDPEFARAAGFERPIMHGLCTHGYACRAVIKHLMPGEPERMTRFRVRFSRPLYPGVPIRTAIWKRDEGHAVFKVLNAESGETVIDHGVVEWTSAEEVARRLARGPIHFADRVAVVTGAGAGLGRAYALELARLGAKVVVNDLGTARDGSGAPSGSAADAVVTEIRAAGGEAVASYDTVATPEGGEAIVRTALEAFGRLDIVIHNAGILRDRTFANMTPEEWSQVLAVHLDGAYHVCRPALKVMRGQGYGRIVLTTSAAGLHGNFGQTNYGAAKMGVVGFLNTVKLEGERYGIRVNAVAPIATTRLTEDILPADLQPRLAPEHVVPMTLYLCAEQCPVSGRIYHAGMGVFGRAAVLTGPGATVGEAGVPPEPEAVAAQIPAIRSMQGAVEYRDALSALTPFVEAFRPKPAQQAGAPAGVGALLARMPERFVAEAAEGVDVVFQFELSGPAGGTWHAVVANGQCTVSEGPHPSPTTTLRMSAEDFTALLQGTLNPMAAYTSGKLKIGGDLMKSQLLGKLFRL